MNQGIDITDDQLLIVQQILRQHLPPDASACAFGSRVTGKAKPYSDLDIAIKASKPLTLEILAALEDAFDESPLPFKIDIAYYSDIYAKLIKSNKDSKLAPIAF